MSEVDYLYGYFSEMAPIRLKLALLSHGIRHSISNSPNYLELGFGQGLAINIHAVTNSGKFYGTDFNPGQVAHAFELANASDRAIEIFEDSFAAFAAREGLPQFDIIAIHGIWSWISPEARADLVQIMGKHLRPGGVAYISYNVTPGWSSSIPLRNLMNEYQKREAVGTILSRVDQSVAFVEEVIAAGAGYFVQNPIAAERLKGIKGQNKHYIAHEYFNSYWNPMPFGEIAEELSQAKLTYAASANILDNLYALSIPAAAMPILQKITDRNLFETVRDYFVNQQFRRDIFVKGARRLSMPEVMAEVRPLRFMPLGKQLAIPTEVVTASGKALLREDVYKPVAQVLLGSFPEPITFEELTSKASGPDLSELQIWEALLVLVSTGFAAPVQTVEVIAETAAWSKQLNKEICRRAIFSENIQHLASPKLGCGVHVSRIEQLFLYALNEGVSSPDGWAWETLKVQGERLIADGAVLEGDKANAAHAAKMYAEFQKSRLSDLQGLGIAL